ncbi:MAG: cyclase family protein [Gemmobacter sp.]
MCNACVIENVKNQMLSRRDLFRASAVTAAAVAVPALLPRQAMAQTSGRVVDLTYTYDDKFPTFDALPGIAYERKADFAANGFQYFNLSVSEHVGTHIDAPLHFTADGLSVDAIEPANLVCPLCVVDIKAKAMDDANAMVSKADIEAWISANGEIPAGACVAMNSGWGAKVGDPSFRTNNPEGTLAFPGFGKDATDFMAELGVVALAVDTLSQDPGNSADFAVHYAWLGSGRYGIENIANLDAVPAKGAMLFVGAPKHRGGSGGPVRVLAMV